ncbi:MAG: CDP-alcohol phosphatidyltransferase family protein [Gammaproteobacteria bacterium]|nr:CDP-alcohol phosphatidyltransferase family protein [Gammaproteobacteria bacterium]
MITVNQDSTLKNLQQELRALACIGLAGLIALGILLSIIWQRAEAIQWTLQSAVIWGFIMVSSLRRLDLVRPKQESPLYKNLGWGNRITLFRSWLIAATAGFLFQPWPDGPLLSWLPGMIYFAGAILDRVDGYVARRSGQSSLFGIELDTVADAIGLAVASLLAVGYGQAHWSFLLMGLAYYAFHAGIYWRKKQNLPVYALPPAMHRRVWAGFQMGYLVVALWPLFYPPLTLIGGFAFMLPALIGFVIDWLIVSGRINRQAANTDRRFYQLTVFSQAIFQPLLRITIVLLLAISILRSGLPPMANTGIVGFSFIASAGFILTSLAILLGIAGRYFALLLIGLLGWYYLNNPMYYLDYLLFCCVIWSLLLGSGRFSLWQEDDRWLNRYDGA